MTKPDPSLSGTRERLIEAAGCVFADRGFGHATVREICAKAGANLAAVNYHFRDKEGLYSAVVAQAQVGHGAMDHVRGEVAEGATPEERLRVFVRNYMRRLFDENRPAWNGKLIAREMIEPTAALDHVVANMIRPRFEFLSSLVREILGNAASDDRVRLCAASVIGQCLIYAHCRPVMDRLFDDERYDRRRTEQRADHIAEFSIAALRAIGARGAASAKSRSAGRTGERAARSASQGAARRSTSTSDRKAGRA